MRPDEFRKAFVLLLENFWIVRKQNYEDYSFLKRYEKELTKEFRGRFGLNIIFNGSFIQLLKRPHELQPWMGKDKFSEPLDYVLLCAIMAFTEELEAETPFMLDELIEKLDVLLPVEGMVDWTNYNHRKSLVRVLKEVVEQDILETIQGDADAFERSEENREVLFITTVQARYFLSRAPQSYTQYPNFESFWTDYQQHRQLEDNQRLYQRLILEMAIERTGENDYDFIRLRNYHRYFKEFFEEKTPFEIELYRDYVALTVEKREVGQKLFPSKRVVDEILIQLATLIRAKDWEKNVFGEITLTMEQWETLIQELQQGYQSGWSKEFREMSGSQLGNRLLDRAQSWLLMKRLGDVLIISPVYGRTIGEMRGNQQEGKPLVKQKNITQKNFIGKPTRKRANQWKGQLSLESFLGE